MSTDLSNERTFSAAHDTPRQAELVTAWKDIPAGAGPDPSTIALGRLRLESLLSETIVVTDAQLLDGAVLRKLAHEELLAGIRRRMDQPLPLEIRCRATSIEGSLDAMFVGDGAVRPFRPSSLPDGSEISNQLRVVPAPQGFGIDRVVGLLERAGADVNELGKAAEGWHRLVELERAGMLVEQGWSSDFAANWVRSLDVYPSAELAEGWGWSQDRQQVIDEAVRLGTYRSGVYRLLDEVDGPGEIPDWVDVIRWWYDQTYLRAIAFQHQANFRGSDDGLTDPLALTQILNDSLPTSQLLKVVLPAGTLTYLGLVDLETWQRFQAERMGHLQRWWRTGDVASIRRVLKDLGQNADNYGTGSPAGGQRAKMLGGTTKAAKVARGLGLTGIAGLATQEPMVGLGTGILLYLIETAAEWRAGSADRAPIVEITDYVAGRA